ncbi:MAG: T9SS type A sorting domain-containing protein [Bacteroidetes bacterium]|nr:T9SS type A sorting domain-containing protein [Bacteroidota bacterium]
MKNIISIAAFVLLIAFHSAAKKVKFAVDMTGQTVNTTGVHVSGDFQTIAGFPGGDWNSGTTTMTQEGASQIDSVVVDLPAFSKYEYKFINGDQYYEAEFVPVESRVGYNFSDSRWIYVDSFANDTSFVGAILFAANAPAGNYLVRFIVDTQTLPSVDGTGMHVAGSFQNWDPTTNFLFSFTSNVHEKIEYVPAGTYEYKFFNGNSIGGAETLPAICSVNSNRELTVTRDTILTSFCFASCTSCLTSINESEMLNGVVFYPNPAKNFTTISFTDLSLSYKISIFDLTGRNISEYHSENNSSVKIETSELNKGIYFVNVIANNYKSFSGKLIVN